MASLSHLIPLILLFIVLGFGGFIAYHIYLWSNELADKANKKMEQKHMTFTRDGGLRVGVKEVHDENVGDTAQK